MTFLADVPLLLKNHFLGGFMVPFACETRLVFLKACMRQSVSILRWTDFG